MNVLLIYPYVTYTSTLWMPLGLPFIAGCLRRDGHNVAIFDRYSAQFKVGHDQHQVDKAMMELVQTFKPDMIGLNTLSPLIYDTVNCVDKLRLVYQGDIIAGGCHATALPDLTLRKIPGLDGIVTGEGELVMSKLAGGENPWQVPGVWWRNGKTIRNPVSPAEQINDLDQLPFPAYDLMDMAFYTQQTDGVIRRHNVPAATLVTSRGCKQKCHFCAESLTYGSGVRCHSPEYVLEWIKLVVSNYQVEGIHFHDNDFLADEQRAREICHRLIASNLHRSIKWSIQARADRLNKDIARLMKASGCVLVEIGVETASQAELDRITKGTTAEMNREAISICRKAGLDVHAYMLTRLEGETLTDLDHRLRWLKRARPTSFQWSGLSVHPGTPLYLEKGKDFFTSSEWTKEAITHYYLTDYLSAIPADVRVAWMARHFAPYHRRHWWFHAIGRYPLRTLLLIAYFKLKRKVQRKSQTTMR